MLAGLTSSAIFWVWSIGDAVKVAKINNMAWRDKGKTGQLQIGPYIRSMPNGKVPVGIALRVRF
jgi:hypothetical protein